MNELQHSNIIYEYGQNLRIISKEENFYFTLMELWMAFFFFNQSSIMNDILQL